MSSSSLLFCDKRPSSLVDETLGKETYWVPFRGSVLKQMRGAQTKTLLAFAVFQMPSVQDNQNIEVAYFGVACFGVACPLTFSTMWIRVPMVIGIPLMLYSSCFLTSGVPALGWTLVYQQEVRPNKATCLNIERKFCTSLPVFFPKSTFLSIP